MYIKTNIEQFLNEDIFRTDNKIKKHEKLFIDAVISFLKEHWDFDAKITVRKKQNSSLIGDISLNTNSVYNNKFTVHFNPNQSYLEIVKSLIHELTHVKQVSKGKLRPSDDWKHILWEDDFNISVKDYRKKMKDFNEYKNLPWEKQAYDNMLDLSLREKLFNSKQWKSLKGKDVNLDFIISNI